MTATYTNQPGTRPIDRVRLEIDDKDTIPETDAMLTDEEITFFISDNANILFASAAAADAVAVKFAGDATTKKVGDLEIDYGDGRSVSYKALADKLRTRGKSRVGAAVYAGGISKTDKDAAEADTDRVQSPFSIGSMNNPATSVDGREDFS